MNNLHQDIFIDIKGRLGAFALDVTFHAPLKGVTALFGPSGCGKTSVLRAIAGLNRLEGTIRIGNDTWQRKNGRDTVFLPTHKRPLGYVFQEASLFPHLSVRANLTFGMTKRNNLPELDFDKVISILGLEKLVTRYPHHLSGGECQRVAIGRALLANPRVLLMDEPLSALDQNMREEIMPFLMRLRECLRLPIFYITHDMREVERLADYLVLIQNGRVLAEGTLQSLQADLSLPLAHNTGAGVSLETEISHWDSDSGLATLRVAGGYFKMPLAMHPDCQSMRLKISASDVSLTLEKPAASTILNILPARILSTTMLDRHEILASLALVEEEKQGETILARLSVFSWDRLGLHEGQRVYAQIKGIAILPRF